MTELVQLTVKRLARIDRGVELDNQVRALIATRAPVAIAVSGGKDSVAAAFATVAHLDAVGHLGPRILIHADLGVVEWKDSLPTCERLAKALELELLVVRRAAGDMMDRWEKRWSNNVTRYLNLECVKLILPWSTPSMRFCTSELKSAPMASALVRRFPGQRIISACGVRREESSTRAKAPTSKENERLVNRKHKTSGIDWNPIAAWTEADVFAYAASRGFEMHEGYAKYGMSRISCAYCIMSKESDLRASASCADNADVYRRMVKLEIRSSFAFQGSRWLGDVAPQLLDAGDAWMIQRAKTHAIARVQVESEIPKHLLFTKGWPHVMPTMDEAKILCRVREDIADLLSLGAVKYRKPKDLLARYAELIEQKRQKDKAKSAQRSKS